MKMSRFLSIAILGIALVASPVYAQRGGGGGGRSGGGGGHSSSSVSRGGGSVSRSSGSSFSGSSRSSSSFSRSSSSSPRSSSSFSRSSSNYSRSSSSTSSPSVRSSSSFSSSSRGSSSFGGSRSEGTRFSDPSDNNSRSFESRSNNSVRSRTGSVPSQVRRADAKHGEGNGRVVSTHGRPSGIAPAPSTPERGYARPGHPGPLPPSHRPIHPAPYFWHPHHHCMVHCHRLYWDPFIPRPYYWPGFWVYCDSYWYDYHVTDVVVVREYVRNTYKLDLITYAFSGDYMYALVNDPDGHTYLQIYDRNDKLLAEQQVSRKYCKIEVDPENGGCWIMKKRDKDPLLFFYTEDGQLLIYEAD